MKNTLLRLAAETRHKFESGDVDAVLLKDLYHHYNPVVKDIVGFIERASILFPVSNCGVASLYLRHKLGAGTIINGTYDNNGHTFLLIGGLVMDITADQFGGPSVYVGSLKKPWAVAK